MVRLGEPTRYRGRLIVPSSMTRVRWLPPEESEDFTWGSRSRRGALLPVAAARRVDTLEVEATLQVFRLGDIAIPGLRFQVQEAGRTRIGRLPLVRLNVISVMTPADSNATLRPLRGPIAAPWWERVPWTWVVVALLALGGAIAFYLLVEEAPAASRSPVVAPVYDPAAEALAALAALRGLNLPAHGRYGEHAFHLTRIVRRFLEETAHTPRPGDTTPELLGHLERRALEADGSGPAGEAVAGLGPGEVRARALVRRGSAARRASGRGAGAPQVRTRTAGQGGLRCAGTFRWPCCCCSWCRSSSGARAGARARAAVLWVRSGSWGSTVAASLVRGLEVLPWVALVAGAWSRSRARSRASG